MGASLDVVVVTSVPVVREEVVAGPVLGTEVVVVAPDVSVVAVCPGLSGPHAITAMKREPSEMRGSRLGMGRRIRPGHGKGKMRALRARASICSRTDKMRAPRARASIHDMQCHSLAAGASVPVVESSRGPRMGRYGVGVVGAACGGRKRWNNESRVWDRACCGLCMGSPRLVLLVGSILALPACNAAKGESTETMTGSTEATSETGAPTGTGGAPEACACIEPEMFGASSFSCGGWACPMLTARCEPGESGSGDTCTGEFLVDEAALDCMIDRLIAGEEGLVAWEFTADSNFSADGGFVTILPDREGLARSWQRFDLGGTNSPAGVVPLKSEEYFEACKGRACT